MNSWSRRTAACPACLDLLFQKVRAMTGPDIPRRRLLPPCSPSSPSPQQLHIRNCQRQPPHLPFAPPAVVQPGLGHHPFHGGDMGSNPIGVILAKSGDLQACAPKSCRFRGPSAAATARAFALLLSCGPATSRQPPNPISSATPQGLAHPPSETNDYENRRRRSCSPPQPFAEEGYYRFPTIHDDCGLPARTTLRVPVAGGPGPAAHHTPRHGSLPRSAPTAKWLAFAPNIRANCDVYVMLQ